VRAQAVQQHEPYGIGGWADPTIVDLLLDQRRQIAGITLLEARVDRPLRPHWVQQFDQILS